MNGALALLANEDSYSRPRVLLGPAGAEPATGST